MRKFVSIVLLLLNSLALYAQEFDDVLTYDSISLHYYDKGDYFNTIEYAEKGLAISETLDIDSFRITFLSRLSFSCDYLGKYEMCQEYNFRLLDLYQENDDRMGIGHALNDIGIIHYYKEEYEDALIYAKKALKIFEELRDTVGIAMCYNNIANNYADDDQFPLSLDYYNKALKLNRKLDDYQGEVMCLGNIGETYYAMGQLDKAGEYYLKAIDDGYRYDIDRWYLITPFLGASQYYLDKGDKEKALKYADKVLQITEPNGFRAEASLGYSMMSQIYEESGDFEKSLMYFRKHKLLEDTIYKDENRSIIAELNAKYKLNEKDNQIELQKMSLEAEKRIGQRNQIIMIIMICMVLAVLVFVYFLMKENKRRKRINALLNEKNDVIEEKNQSIMESIMYARKIQNAILPLHDEIQQSFPEYFVLYKPKDIVSGDFYWYDKHGDMSIIAAVDCTGHGVPGAFMSMMANDLLNQIVKDDHVEHPWLALDLLDRRIKQNLRKDDENTEGRDGLDIALCAYNHRLNVLEYAGAKNDLYLIRNDELLVFKANRYSIGGTITGKTFEGHEIEVQKGDVFYLFTDGFADQFGGERDKKFTYKRFKNVLLEHSKASIKEQEDLLNQVLTEWKGDNEQLDDICIIGLKF